MNRERIISTLCGAKINKNNFELCEGLLCNKCHHDKYCDLLHLSDNQIDYILTDISDDIYLKACPGSGKTEVIGVKCAYEMKQWISGISGIAILTFTNSAENELRERVTSYYKQQIGYPHFMGTFTSWLHGYIANPYLYCVTGHGKINDKSIQIIDSDCSSDFLNAFRTRYSYGNLHKIAANEYSFNPKEKKYQYCGKLQNGQQEFDDALKHINYMSDDIKKTKDKLWKAGFFLYEDVEILSFKLLKKRPEISELIAKRFPLIIVDECQDLSYIQLLILQVLQKHGAHIHLIGDLNQAIYGFRDIEPNDTQKFIIKNKLREMMLNENYRSNQSIVDISGTFIRRTNPVYGQNHQLVQNPLIVFLYSQNQENLMIKKYQTILEQEKLDLDNCRIIARNDTLRKKLNGSKNISFNDSINTIEDYAQFIYLNKKNNVKDFQRGIQLLSRAIQRSFFANSRHENIVNLYRPEELDSSEWIEIILLIQNALLSNIMLLDLTQDWQNWKKVLNECLKGLSNSELKKFDLKRLRNNIKLNPVIRTFEDGTNTVCNHSLLVETIHGCKGMSLDSVLFVSTYKQSTNASGAYWTEWFPIDERAICEAQRLAYVAVSRAKHLLALGIPNPKSSPISQEKIDMLKKMGFQIFDCTSNTWIE